MEAHTIHKSYRQSLLQLADAMAPYHFLRKEEAELRNVADNLQSPFNIAVFGRMKTGKSTLINALLGKQLAITGVEEATATINRISYADGDLLDKFTVHWQDKQPEDFPLAQLQTDWNGKSPEVLERISKTAWLELYANAPALRNIRITDTPGTGSNANEHEKIAQQFINGQVADALLYVFSPVGRATNAKDLASYRDGCLPGSNLDNSVGVLHKWDHIYWNEDDWESIVSKAKRVHEFLKDLISTIIPVSAPLALLAKSAPESFWQECRNVLSTFKSIDELTKILKDEDEWEEVAALEKLYHQAKIMGCPLASFRIMLRHIFRNPGQEAAAAVLKLSGFQDLETLLDRQIFCNCSVIQQKQNCARARRIMDRVEHNIENELEKQRHDIEMMEQIYSLIDNKDAFARRWIDAKRAETIQANKHLLSEYTSLSKQRHRVADWSDAITQAADLTSWLANYAEIGLPKETAELFTRILVLLMPGSDKHNVPGLKELQPHITFFGRLKALPSVSDKQKAENLHKCIMHWCQQQLA